MTHPLYHNHDQLAAEGHFNVGVGLAYALSEKFDLVAVYGQSLRGENGHKLVDGLSLGIRYDCPCAFRQAPGSPD